jgi:hypothetical protein
MGDFMKNLQKRGARFSRRNAGDMENSILGAPAPEGMGNPEGWKTAAVPGWISGGECVFSVFVALATGFISPYLTSNIFLS